MPSSADGELPLISPPDPPAADPPAADPAPPAPALRTGSPICTSTRSTRGRAAATSPCANLAWWARRKGIALLGTGDFTHPAWFDHLRETLRAGRAGPVPARPRARGTTSAQRLPPSAGSADAPVRFMLSVEISTIYKRDDRTRKVHHLIYLPDLDGGRPVQHRARAGSATSAPTAARSSASTRATCWRSRWRRARTATWCRRTSGRRGSPRWAPSRASTRSPTATPTWPSTSSRSRPACPPTRR